ncbi:hypothetical protein ROHU_000893 [Labeo rohita]|uniref:Uncharacterized protein n=1 Tax=Labeo rohita TaxID=84645 RepID=A0A498MDR9_LABRO|nr:hypothetical protein ROHU_026892 [Labeo rohita]RXN38686.1 hypothetical protein ROHU_000893 [Labeo rohita]
MFCHSLSLHSCSNVKKSMTQIDILSFNRHPNASMRSAVIWVKEALEPFMQPLAWMMAYRDTRLINIATKMDITRLKDRTEIYDHRMPLLPQPQVAIKFVPNRNIKFISIIADKK